MIRLALYGFYFLSYLAIVWISKRSQTNETLDIQYLDNDFPGLVPKQYAKGIINQEGRYQQNMTINSQTGEHYITITNSDEWRYMTIQRIALIDGQVSIDTPQFVQDFTFENNHFIGEPMLSADNQSLYFVADYPPNIWSTSLTSSKEWGIPENLTVSTSEADWYPTATQKWLYFSNGTIHQFELNDSTRLRKSEVQLPTDAKPILDPYIADDFMIYGQEQSDGSGQTDMFLRTKTEAGWTTPVSLGPEINTDHFEFAPYVSPDGKYFFFSRRDSWQSATSSNIYWVSIQFLEELAPKK